MSEAKERFKSDDLFGATQLANRAQSPYPSLPDLSNFIVTLRVLSTAVMPHRPQTTPPITPSSAPKPTDTIHAIKHKYRKLCIQTHPAFKLVHQARNALNNKPKVKNSTTTATELNLEEAKRERGQKPRRDSKPTKKTDSFEVVKNKYRVLCERTISVGNLNVAAETAFRIVNQAWDAPMNRVSSNSCPQR